MSLALLRTRSALGRPAPPPGPSRLGIKLPLLPRPPPPPTNGGVMLFTPPTLLPSL